MITSLNLGLIMAEAAAEAEATGLVDQFGINGPKLVAQALVFIVFFLILRRFAFKPVLQVLEQRRKMIEESVTNAERIRKELEEAEKTRSTLIHQANEQASKLIEEAKAGADAVGAKKIQEAVAQAEAVLKKAEEAAASERERIMSELKQEMGRLVVATTAKVVGRTLTPEDQARLQKEAAENVS